MPRPLTCSPLMALATVMIAVLPLRPANILAGQVVPTSGIQPPPEPVFTTKSDLVVINLSVKDRKGGYVSDLSVDAFAVFENKQPQPISFFVSQDAPVTVGLLLDSSGSMSANRELLISAAASFAATSNPEDEIFALAFNDTVTPVLPKGAPFTADPDILRRAVSVATETHGRTALYDALAAGLDYLARGTRERKVLIVVSDGGDNASRTTAQEIWKQTQASNVVVYTVALLDDVERESNPKALKRIADATGGEAFRPRSIRDVADVLRHIAADIRHAYTIGYVPTNAEHDGTFRNLRVVVRAPDRRAITVRTRSGYVAGTSASRSTP
ncbi:MAG: VWA domain-containing protein [Acidobacteriota bacterium]